MSEEVVADEKNLSEYYDSINIFYADRLKSSLKKKYNSCPGCKGNRLFIVKNDELIYSCGSTSGKCGKQFTIKVAKYIDYQLIKRDLSQFTKRTPSLEKLKAEINVQKEIKRYDSFKDQSKELLKNTTKTYIRENDLKKRAKEIEKYQEEKVKILIEMNKLKSLMNDPNESKQKEYRHKYLSLSNEMNLIYRKFREITDIPINNKIMMDEPQIRKKSSHYEEKEVKKKEVKEQAEDKINYFSRSKHNKWLSAFNVAEPFTYEENKYPSVEHAFHAQKLDPDDDRRDEYIALFTDLKSPPSEAKKNGGKGSFKKRGFIIRDDWDSVKLKIMYEIIKAYYEQNDRMKQLLIQTGNKELIHYGPRIDEFWGQKKDGSGKNHHGKILMKIRDEIS